MVGAGGWWRESMLHGDSVSVWEDGKFWKWGGVFAQWCECASCHGAVHLETVMMVNFMLCMLPQ